MPTGGRVTDQLIHKNARVDLDYRESFVVSMRDDDRWCIAFPECLNKSFQGRVHDVMCIQLIVDFHTVCVAGGADEIWKRDDRRVF